MTHEPKFGCRWQVIREHQEHDPPMMCEDDDGQFVLHEHFAVLQNQLSDSHAVQVRLAQEYKERSTALRQEIERLQATLARVEGELAKWQQPFDAELFAATKEQASRGESLAAQGVYITALEHALNQAEQREARLERMLRERIWRQHGTTQQHLLYGDDGRLDCNSCGRDYAAMPLYTLFLCEMNEAHQALNQKETTT